MAPSTQRRGKPLLGITLGDPCGIGPEVVLKALALAGTRRCARFAIIGSDPVLRAVADRFGIRGVRWRVVTGLRRSLPEEPIPLIPVGRACRRLALKAKATAAGGKCSLLWVEAAIDMALAGELDAIVTAPINKEALAKAGAPWPGHTEILAARTGAAKPVMMMAGGGVRAALVTTHASIRDLPGLITMENVLAAIRVTARDLARYFGMARPRLAVCGLNPHAGEAGLFGNEEQRAVAPAIEAARKEGIDCSGPFPADVVYVPARRRGFDAVIAMYHDQANIPVKMLAFERGVNVTLGLPIIRTSPDHGTAYDIAPRGVADPGSLIAAIRMAARMARCARGAS